MISVYINHTDDKPVSACGKFAGYYKALDKLAKSRQHDHVYMYHSNVDKWYRISFWQDGNKWEATEIPDPTTQTHAYSQASLLEETH